MLTISLHQLLSLLANEKCILFKTIISRQSFQHFKSIKQWLSNSNAYAQNLIWTAIVRHYWDANIFRNMNLISKCFTKGKQERRKIEFWVNKWSNTASHKCHINIVTREKRLLICKTLFSSKRFAYFLHVLWSNLPQY